MKAAPRRSSRRLKSRQQQSTTTTGSRRTQRTLRSRVKGKTIVYTSGDDEKAEQLKRRNHPRPKGLIPIPALNPNNDPSPDETSSANVSQPISTLVHPTLRNSWAINKSVNMCFIFDAVSPARQFKRGVLFDESGTFPDYADGDQGDVTETDMRGAPGLMPYMPRDNM